MMCATKNDVPRLQNVFENLTFDADVAHKRIKTNETNIMLVANHLMRTLRSENRCQDPLRRRKKILPPKT